MTFPALLDLNEFVEKVAAGPDQSATVASEMTAPFSDDSSSTTDSNGPGNSALPPPGAPASAVPVSKVEKRDGTPVGGEVDEGICADEDSGKNRFVRGGV